MADSILIKSGDLGNREEMPKLAYDKEKGSEIGYRTDEKALYIGTSTGNMRLCGAEDNDALKKYVDALVANINARLDALTAPSE